MARTKKQARAAREESVQRSTAVNEEERSRVGTTIAEAEVGEKARSASSSERARRATRRGKANGHGTSTEPMVDDGPQIPVEEAVGGDGMDDDSGDGHMTPAARGVFSENYYTTLDGDVEETWA